jgi:hypothetical protein
MSRVFEYTIGVGVVLVHLVRLTIEQRAQLHEEAARPHRRSRLSPRVKPDLDSVSVITDKE